MADDVIVAKAEIVERCIKRAREELAASADFTTDYTRLGVPSSTRNGYERLVGVGVIDQTLADKLMRMVGFRNLAVHQYRSLDLAIVRAVIEKSLDDLREFSAVGLRL